MKNIDEIILDYVVGENLSEEERRELDEWLRERRNSRLVEVLKKMSEERELRQALSLHKEEGMRMIREKIRKRNRRMRLRYACSAAACVLLLAGAFFLWDLRENKPVEQPVGISSLWMESDHAGVRLELGDGNVVSLEDCGDEMVVADSLHHVRNENNTLVYSGESRQEDSLVFNTLIVPLGAEYRLVLADGTRVCLNAGSELRFPVSFRGDSREVYLTGEAYFEVAKDSARIFQVHTEAMTAIVLGTSFDMRAYPDQELAVATLAEGHLRVDCGRQTYDLSQGKQLRFNRETQESELLDVNVEQYVSWKDGYYCFDGMRLEEIMEMLSVWYGFEVEYVDEEVGHYLLTGRLKRYDDYSYLLRKFGETGGIDVDIEDDLVRIKKKDEDF